MNANIDLSDAAFRASVVGGSEVAALFDASPWLTRFELWHRKNGTIATPQFNAIDETGKPADERIFWGVKLEAAVIEGAMERYGYRRDETPGRLDNGKGLGGHPDCFVTCPERGPGLLEVKTTDWLQAKKWGDEPPLHYLLQTQAYLGLAGRAWADLIVLVGGNELRRFQYDFRPKVYADIERRVVEFWQSVRAGDEPRPDFARDGDTLREVLGDPTDELIDLRGDNSADHLAAEFLNAKADRDAAELRMDVAKCELMLKIGSAGTALLGFHRIGCGQTKGSPDKEITAEMVGTIIKGRKGYRRFDVKETA